MVIKRLDCKWSGFQMGSQIWKPNHLKPDKWVPFCKKYFLKSRPKRSDFKWSNFQLFGTSISHIPKSWTFWKQDNLKCDLQLVRISNVLPKWSDFRSHCTHKFCFDFVNRNLYTKSQYSENQYLQSNFSLLIFSWIK